jgi:hypothetical protein
MHISKSTVVAVSAMDVARATGIGRNMLSKLYYDRAQRVDLVDVAQLCEYLNSVRFRYKPPHNGETFPNEACLRAQMYRISDRYLHRLQAASGVRAR